MIQVDMIAQGGHHRENVGDSFGGGQNRIILIIGGIEIQVESSERFRVGETSPGSLGSLITGIHISGVRKLEERLLGRGRRVHSPEYPRRQ